MLSEHEFEDGSPDSEKEFLVFVSCLNNYPKKCPKCGGVIIDQKRKMAGSMLSVILTCHNGHTELWEPQLLKGSSWKIYYWQQPSFLQEAPYQASEGLHQYLFPVVN